MVLGVFGDWGSGKTSFLRQLQFLLTYDAPLDQVAEAIIGYQPEEGAYEDLEPSTLVPKLHKQLMGKHKVLRSAPVVWFDAWHYQNEPAPVAALLHEIQRQFSPGRKLWNFIVKNGQITVESALLTIDPIKNFIKPMQEKAAQFEAEHLQTELSTEQIRRLLSEAIRKIVGSVDYPALLNFFGFKANDSAIAPGDRPRLVIIIDDLDRCEPEMAIKLLEGIKVFMNLDNCVFVLGLNEGKLISHVASQSKDYDAKDRESVLRCQHRAKDYLDKIINRHYSLGIAFDRAELVEHEVSRMRFKVPDPEALASELVKIVNRPRILPPNARKLKGFLATLRRYRSVHFDIQPDPDLLILFAYLNQFHTRVVRKIAYYPGYARQFFEWASTNEIASNEGFDGLLPSPEVSKNAAPKANEPLDSASRYHDPINDNVFHAQALAVSWWETKENKVKFSLNDPSLTESEQNEALMNALEPYILLA